jgi:hypothetical protein
MTETPETRIEPTAVAPDRRTTEKSPRHDRPNKLNRIAAVVGIVAGVVFIVAAIFFSGFVLGVHSGGSFGRDHHGGEFGMMNRYGGQPMGPGQLMGPGGMMEPGGMVGPGGMMGPGQMGPGQQQSPTATSAVPNSPRP